MNIVAVCASADGIDSAQRARRALEDEARRQGHNIKVEAQNERMALNHIIPGEAATADVAILAADSRLAGSCRFEKTQTVSVPCQTAELNAADIIRRATQVLQ